MATVVGQASAAATSVAIPAHQAGDLILVFARGTAAAPTKPAAAGTVPAWETIQTGLANAVGLHSAAFVATGSTTTTGVWTSATHIAVLVLRPDAGKILSTAAARSAVGSGNNTQTIIYPALVLAKTDGTSLGVRCGTRGVADSEVGTNVPAGWTNRVIQPAGASALLAVHTRAALVANPTADSVATAGTNSAYRAHTIEVLEFVASQTIQVTGPGSAALFGTSALTVKGPPQAVVVKSVQPSGIDPHIAGEYLAGQALVGWAGSQFGVPTVQVLVGQNVAVSGVPSAQAFGVSLPRPLFRLSVTGVGTAQSFGAVTPKSVVRRSVTGLGSAQAFGTPLPRTTVSKLVGGVASAQAFVAPLAIPKTTVPVGGIGSAQSFGTPSLQSGSSRVVPVAGLARVPQCGAPTITTRVVRAVSGLGTAQAFGTTSVRASINRAVGGIASPQSFGTVTIKTVARFGPTSVPSAQAFGSVRAILRQFVPLTGVNTAQAFGVPGTQLGYPQSVQVPGIDHGRLYFHIVGTKLAGEALVGWDGDYLFGRPVFGMQYRLLGVPSAQQFGSPYIYWQQFLPLQGIPSAQQFGTPWFVYDQPQDVPGLGSAQAFGKPLVYRSYLRPVPPFEVLLPPSACTDLDLILSACTELSLDVAPEGELVLVGSACTDLDLEPAEEL